ncbi:MAG TPA: hypothetical protein VHG34_00755 [Nitrososphaeraceae archaeon]|nr:hypothetical protein [Nitrososphaeraceae archaeon]
MPLFLESGKRKGKFPTTHFLFQLLILKPTALLLVRIRGVFWDLAYGRGYEEKS